MKKYYIYFPLNKVQNELCANDLADILELPVDYGYKIIKQEGFPSSLKNGELVVEYNDFLDWLSSRGGDLGIDLTGLI